MRERERCHTVGKPIACCTWQPNDYYTVQPLQPFEFPTMSSISVPSSSVLSLGATIVPLYIYIPLSLEPLVSLSVFPVHFVSTEPTLAPTILSRLLIRFSLLYLSFHLSRILCSPLSFSISLCLFRVVSLPSRSRLHRTGEAPADFAFKFGKFAGVGKWAAGMVSNTRARARPPIHCV